ncbi:hypothetical protein EJB05_41138, partial [Eragrostis curvula]
MPVGWKSDGINCKLAGTPSSPTGSFKRSKDEEENQKYRKLFGVKQRLEQYHMSGAIGCRTLASYLAVTDGNTVVASCSHVPHSCPHAHLDSSPNGYVTTARWWMMIDAVVVVACKTRATRSRV